MRTLKIGPVSDEEIQAWIMAHLETREQQRAREVPSWVEEENDQLEMEKSEGISRPAQPEYFGGK